MGKNIEKSDCLNDFNNFDKNWGWRDDLVCCIEKIYRQFSGTLKHKLQATVPVMLWYFLKVASKVKTNTT